MTQQVRFERVHEDHDVERVHTHLDGKRGRTIEVHVQHREIGGTYRDNYTLALFVRVVQNIDGDNVLEVRPHNDAERGPGVKAATMLIQLTPDPRMFR